MKPCLLKKKIDATIKNYQKKYFVGLLAKNKSDFKATCKILNCATKSFEM